MSILQTVKGSPLFYDLYDEEILLIVGDCKVMTLDPGQNVFSVGDEGNEIYFILSGCAEVKKDGVKLTELRKGDLFGELVLLNEKKRQADVVANTYTDVLILDYDLIYQMYESRPKVFALVMLNLARMLARRLKSAGDQIQKLKIAAAKAS